MKIGSVEDRPYCGCPLSTSPQKDCLLPHRSLTNKMVTSITLLLWLHNSFGCTMQLELIQPPEELEEDTEFWIK